MKGESLIGECSIGEGLVFEVGVSMIWSGEDFDGVLRGGVPLMGVPLMTDEECTSSSVSRIFFEGVTTTLSSFSWSSVGWISLFRCAGVLRTPSAAATWIEGLLVGRGFRLRGLLANTGLLSMNSCETLDRLGRAML